MSRSTAPDPVSVGAAGLERLLGRLQATPPSFYAEAGATPASGTAAECLARLPLTTRAALLADQLAHLPLGTRMFPDAGHVIRVGKTGTGDGLLLLSWTAADLAREIEAGVRVFGRLGVSAGMRVANALPGALATPGALLLGDVIEAIGALDVPLGAIDGPPAAKGAWELLERVEPAVLVLTATSATHLFAAAGEGARPWWRGIVWLRTDTDPTPARPIPPAGFAGWQRTWLAAPDAASFVAHEVVPGRFQVDEGVYAEAADGRLVLTPLGRDAALVRHPTAFAVRSVDPASGIVTLP